MGRQQRRTVGGGQVGKLVEVLARIFRVGDDKAKVKVEALEELFPEEMPLHHAEVVDRLVAHPELNAGERERVRGDIERGEEEAEGQG